MKTPPARTTMPRWWSRFSHRGSAVLAMVFVLSLAVFGALAPLLAQDRPYCIGQGSDRVWPAFRALTRVDLVWLVALGTLTAAWITWRLARRRAWVLVVTCLALVFGGGLVAHQRPHLESRRYLREEGLRRRLVTIDEARGDRATTRQALVDLSRASFDCLAVAEAVEARVEALDDEVVGSELTARNLRELQALEAAWYPPLRQAPDQTSFVGLLRPGDDPAHPLGTDSFGRDLASILLHGSRRALAMAFIATSISALLGFFLGGLAGYLGGRIDWVVQRLFEFTLCLPALFMIVVLASRLPPELRSGSAAVAAFLGLLMWPEAGRLTRSAVGQARREDYVVAAYALGLSRWRILWRHVLPNTMTPLLVSASFTAAGVVLVDATLSFLGLGQESAPGWGRVLHDARSQASLGVAWHLAVFPGLLAFLCVLSFITIGDALRRAADPRR